MKNQFNELWNKYQIFIWPLIGGGISIALLILVIVPQLFKILNTNTKIEETKQKIDKLNNKVADLKKVNVSEYKDNFNKLNIVIPTRIDAPSAISQIQTIAASSNVQIVSFGVAIPQTDSGTNNFLIKVEFKGSNASINNFIEQLKNAPRLMTINKIEITGDKTGTNFNTTLAIQAYFSKQQTTLSAIEDSITLLSDKDKELLSKIDKSVKTIPVVSEDTITGPKGKPNPFE